MSLFGSAVLVTGGSGFVGSHVIAKLRSDDESLRIFSMSRHPVGSQKIAGVIPWCADLASNVELPIGIDTIIHIAGEKRDEARMWPINYEGTRSLVEAASRANVRRFIYLGSVGVYGAPKHAGIVDKNYRRTPRNAYEASKNAGENCVRELCLKLGIEHMIVQPTNVIGHVPGNIYPLLGLMTTIKAGRFARFGSDETWTNYLGVDDAAALIVAAFCRGRDGGVYIANTPARLSDLVAWICNELGLPLLARRLPTWVGVAAGFAGSVVQSITKRNMPFNAERYLELTNTTQYDGQTAAYELDFVYPVGIEATVRNLVQIYRSAGQL